MPQFISANSLFSPPELDALRADLGAADPSVRKIALAALGPLLADETPGSIVGAIAGALTDADAGVRELAADALAAVGPRAREALPRLVAALGDPAPRVRRAAASAIERVGAGEATAVRGLVRGLGDADAEVREQCAAALGDLAGAGEDPEVSICDATWGAACVTLTTAARDFVPAVRRAAIRALVAFAERGKGSAPAAEVVSAALADLAPGVRIEGLRLLAGANMSAADSLPLLIGLLADPDAGVRRLAARALGRLGADGALAAPALHTALADNDRLVARAAAGALALVSFDQRPWLQYLLQIRRFAGSARPELGVRAMQLLDAPVEEVAAWLDELVGDADEGIRWNAGLGLWRCGTSAGVARAALSRMLTDHSSALRVAAVVGLLGAGPAAGADSARLLALRLKDDELWVRQLAAVALGAIGRSAEVALPALTVATGDEREEVRSAAADAIRAITAA